MIYKHWFKIEFEYDAYEDAICFYVNYDNKLVKYKFDKEQDIFKELWSVNTPNISDILFYPNGNLVCMTHANQLVAIGYIDGKIL